MSSFREKKYSLDAVLEFTERIDSDKFYTELVSSPKFKFSAVIAEKDSELHEHIKRECRLANMSLELYRLQKAMNPRFSSLCFIFTNTYSAHHNMPAERLETDIQSYVGAIEAVNILVNPYPARYAVAERSLLLLSLYVEDSAAVSKEDKIAEAAGILDRQSKYWEEVKAYAVFTEDPRYSKVVKVEERAGW